MLALTPPVTVSGIIAMTGSPAPPVHPQNASGSGDSTMNFDRLVVAPLPGNKIGAVCAAWAPRPRSTSSVAPERHGDVAWLSHLPKPTVCKLGRSTPIA